MSIRPRLRRSRNCSGGWKSPARDPWPSTPGGSSGAVTTERAFRVNKVIPFLKTLANTVSFPIQQVAISGDPDFMLCCRGRFVGLELKRKGQKPRPLQNFKLGEIVRTGGVALAADPDNWASIKELLTRLDQGEI